MSLVSSLSGNICWNDRASEIESRYNQLVDKISTITDEAGRIGEAISRLDNQTSMNQTRVFALQSMLANQTDPGQRSKIESMLAALLSQPKNDQMAKLMLEMKKNKLHKEEKQLEKEKTLMDVQKKLAQQTAESMGKMQDAALKRLTIQV
ncbi:MAG: hypothetical protein A2Y25_06285 [Candidatus Melainabacteria bacterium GWF2_37_15]|nr:MAG: hypothetical protein A2Y25_06285 [Candidatus Melainabacteria bacterium GWF2_37_15]